MIDLNLVDANLDLTGDRAFVRAAADAIWYRTVATGRHRRAVDTDRDAKANVALPDAVPGVLRDALPDALPDALIAEAGFARDALAGTPR